MRMTARLIRPGFLASLLALFGAAGAVAQDPAAAPPPADGIEEGVAVHGHWTITIVRDGKVVERADFQNAVLADGFRHLGILMAGERTPGDWQISLVSDGSEALCGASANCFINEPDLTVTPPDASTGPGVLGLDGSVVAERGGNITRVNTRQRYCAAATAATDCVGATGSSSLTFSAHDPEPIIPVQAGDRIDVMVQLSFIP
ncbi:MAG: hypothetical protein ABFS34_12670 [Gemmatimonadota bacterium]